MTAAGARVERENKNRGWLAWHIAALQRTERMPKLSAFLADKPRATQDPEAIKAIFNAL